MTDNEIAARLAFQTFLLEQLFANNSLTTADPIGHWASFSKDMLELIGKKTTTRAGVAPPEMHAELTAVAERFCERVAERLEQDQG